VHLAWNADGTYHGVASFDVVPGGRSRCTLHFPPHCRPVQILVGGVPTTPSSRSRVAGDTAQSGTKYQVPLASGKLPQRIEMVFEGKEADWGAGRCRFQSPSLGHLPVRSALWTVSSPPLYRAREPVEALSTKPLRQEMLRLRSMVELIETASDTATTETDTVARWYHLWKNRLHASGKRLKRGLIHTDRGKLSQAAAEELPSIQELETTLAGRFGDSVNKQEAPDKTHLATDPSELWHATLERPGALTRYIVRTGDPSLVIEYARSEPGWFASRLPPALGLILALLLIVAGIRRGIWQALWFRWPHLVGVAAGIGWWLWLWPSMLGWILVAGSLISALRPGWRLRRQPDSSVVRLS